MSINSQYHKNCPECGRVIFYSRKDGLQRSIIENRLCNFCKFKGDRGFWYGKNGVWLGKHHTNEAKEKMSEIKKGKKFTDEHKKNLSKSLIGRQGYWEGKKLSENHIKKLSDSHKGKTHSIESKYKCRLALINRLKKRGIELGKVSYNPQACQFIDQLNKERGWNLQHALNGGEVELYGYFVDGYDKERNIIFEYDEPPHQNLIIKNKDIIRQKNLIDKLKPSVFLRYDEKDRVLYDVITDKKYSI